MTDRIRFLREETISGRNKAARCQIPAMDVSGEAGGIPVRKAKGFLWLCENMPLFIGPQERIVGTRTYYDYASFVPDTVDWDVPVLAAYPKFVTDAEIVRFGGDFSRKNSQHYTPDFSLLLDSGIGGLLERARQRREDPDLREDQREFLDSVNLAYTGLQRLILRYAELAAKQACAAETREDMQRLEKIRDVCRAISTHAPGDFHEAVQLFWFGHLATILESFIFINYGRLDVILGPYLKDTPREDALELLECLLLKMYDMADMKDGSYFLRHEGQMVVTLGGELPNGESAVNPVTMLLLEALDVARLPEPEVNLRVSSKNPDAYLQRAAALTVTGCNFVSYYNDDVIIPALISAGMEPCDARSYGFDLCQDLNIPGKCDPYNIFSFSMAYELMDMLKEKSDFADFDQLLAALKRRFSDSLERSMEICNRQQENLLHYGNGRCEEYFRGVGEFEYNREWDGRHPMCPLPLLSGMYHGTIENAMDMIYESYPLKHKGGMIGTAVEAVNSLAAIRKVVFDDRRYTLSQVVQACCDDFRQPGQEVMRCLLWNAPKWGNDDPYVDLIAKDLLESCLREFSRYTTFTGGKVLSGIHQPHPVASGWTLMATPEGRHAGTPTAVTMTPESGTMRAGATAALKSASIFDPMLLQWNYCFMINYFASVFSGPEGSETFLQLLRGYFRRGGVQHQPNVMDVKTLREAQLAPEKYKDLVVRLWGVSAHFVDLPGELQEELIARMS